MGQTIKRAGVASALIVLVAAAALATYAYSGSVLGAFAVSPIEGRFNVTFTLFTNHNVTRLAAAGVVLHYNGLVYVAEGVSASVMQIERSKVVEGNRTTITVSITKMSEAVSDANGRVSFSLPAGRYVLQLQLTAPDGQVVKLRPIPFVVFSDILQNVVLESLRPHHR